MQLPSHSLLVWLHHLDFLSPIQMELTAPGIFNYQWDNWFNSIFYILMFNGLQAVGEIILFLKIFLTKLMLFHHNNIIILIFRVDSLRIYDGGSNTSPMLGNPSCGDSFPPSQISSSNQLFFHFYSDMFTTGTGFQLKYNVTSKNQYKVYSCALCV